MKRPLIVGIAGGSGSGKTTLAHGLRDLMADVDSVVISQDHYYWGLPEGVSPEAYNFDDPAALDLEGLALDLAGLKAGHSIKIPAYDFTSHRRAAAVQAVTPPSLIIVEGLFLFTHPALSAVFDLRFFVDVPSPERLRRRMLRDQRERGRNAAEIREQWDRQVEPMYVRHILPARQNAEFVLNLPHPDDLVYCEQIAALWKTVEERLRANPRTA